MEPNDVLAALTKIATDAGCKTQADVIAMFSPALTAGVKAAKLAEIDKAIAGLQRDRAALVNPG